MLLGIDSFMKTSADDILSCIVTFSALNTNSCYIFLYTHTEKKNIIIPTCKSHLTKQMQRWHLRSHSNSVFYGHGWNHCLVLHPVPLNPILCETDCHARDSPPSPVTVCVRKSGLKWSPTTRYGGRRREEVNVSVILCLFLVLTLPSVKPC